MLTVEDINVYYGAITPSKVSASMFLMAKL